MNTWKCLKCGTLNDDQSTSACCVNCWNSKWVTKSSILPPTGTYFETPQAISCPDCARLKALVGDVWSYVPMPDTLRKDFITKEHYEQLEVRIKQEGIL